MPITVDEAFLDRASKVNDLIGQEVVASPHGDIKAIVLKAGHKFKPGTDVNTAVANIGADLHARLTEIRETANNRSNQLKMFKDFTDNTEDLNSLTALELLNKLPSWNTGTK